MSLDKFEISLIIPTFSRSSDIKNLLDSILEQTIFPCEVIIIDQSIDEATKDLISKFQSIYSNLSFNLIYLRQKEKGTVRARNHGIEIAKGEIVSFLDDDVVLSNDYYAKILEFLKQHPDVGGLSGSEMVGCKNLGFKSKVRDFLSNLFLLNCKNGFMTISGFGYPISCQEVEKPTQVEVLPGHNMNFIKKFVIEDKFDFWFTGYGFREDVDLSYRISKKTKLYMIPDARLTHNYSSAGRLNLKDLKRMQFKNYSYVFKKHFSQTIWNKILFIYSISGLILIDFLELICNLNNKKWSNFSADIKALWAILKEKIPF